MGLPRRGTVPRVPQCQVVVGALLLLCGTLGTHGTLRLQQRFPLCPLTGKTPVKTVGPPTRCLDASDHTCCDKCTDIKQALGLVSANFSTLVQRAGLFPKSLNPLNSWLNGTDANVCTLFEKFSTSSMDPTTGTDCIKYLEQLACAMSCSPLSGSFVTPSEGGGYWLDVCHDSYFDLTLACNQVPLPDDKGKFPQFIGGGFEPQFLNDLGNAVWGLAGLPEFHVRASKLTGPEDVGPSCWMPILPADVPNSPCCDPLALTPACENKIAPALKKRPYLADFASDQNASLSCRIGQSWKGEVVVALSPPPGGKGSGNEAPPKAPPPAVPMASAPPSNNLSSNGSSGNNPENGSNGNNVNILLPTSQPPPPKSSAFGFSMSTLAMCSSFCLLLSLL